MKLKLSDKEIARIKRMVNKQLETFIEDIVILCDTREQQLQHITDVFDSIGVNWVSKKLDTGDYSFTYRQIDYSSIFAIDRKKCINELVGNFLETHKDNTGKKTKSERFHKELERAKEFKYFSFCLEKGCLADLYNAEYRSRLHKNSAIGLIETLKNRFQVDFIEGLDFGFYVYNKMYYWIRSQMIEQIKFDAEMRLNFENGKEIN